ncbi:MAG TPA: YafY family protein [Polyangiaceae bacterium]|nr:YafY family protein [Polyangiaceae bacterium]
MLGTSERLLRLLTTLQTRRHWGGAELAERLEVTARTLRRDVDRLRALGYAVEASSGPGGGYQLGTGTALPPLLLSDEEAVALAVSLRSAADTFTGVSEAVVALLVKLEQLLPNRLRRRVGALHAMTVSIGSGPRWDPEVLITLASACRDCLELEFEYTARDGTPSRRYVEPLRLAHTASRRFYLLAWDLQRSAWRTFRVDRLRAPKTGARFVARPPPPDVERYFAESIAAPPFRYRARVRLFESAETVKARVPRWLGELEPVDDASCVLSIGADTLDAATSHILLAGVDFELLEPPELRAHVQSVAKRLVSGVQRTGAQRKGGRTGARSSDRRRR